MLGANVGEAFNSPEDFAAANQMFSGKPYLISYRSVFVNRNTKSLSNPFIVNSRACLDCCLNCCLNYQHLQRGFLPINRQVSNACAVNKQHYGNSDHQNQTVSTNLLRYQCLAGYYDL